MSSVAARMRAGDREAYGELFREFHPRIAAVCGYLLGSPDEAKDATSEVFARLPAALNTYDTSRPFSSWLLTVAGHYCTDLLRKRRSERNAFRPADPEAPEPTAPAASPLQDLLCEEERQAVRSAVAGLPERYRLPLVLRYYYELSYDEIARDLELTRANVATLIFRAKEQLRRILARRGIGSGAPVSMRGGGRPSYGLTPGREGRARTFLLGQSSEGGRRELVRAKQAAIGSAIALM